MDKLARMDTGPWWRQPFAGWPLFVRMLFLVVSLTVTALVLAASIWVLLQGSMELNAKTSSLFSQIQESFSVMRSIIVQWVPTWMETGLQVIMAVAVVSYLAVLGLGAAIYNVVQPKSAVRSSHA